MTEEDKQAQSDPELAKMLLDRQERCKHLEMDLTDTRHTLKIAQMNLREWQERFTALKKSITFPKLLGFQLAMVGPPVKKVSAPLPLLDAVNKLLAKQHQGECMLIPVFNGDIDKQKPPGADDSNEDGCEPVG